MGTMQISSRKLSDILPVFTVTTLQFSMVSVQAAVLCTRKVQWTEAQS